ncbi:MAG: hypothetical protein LBH37_04230 [Oscillospiraceae bacterium]|jgi:hypothetical protein|nr:hypothetical protein [Oscillospiraceae bacterium]
MRKKIKKDAKSFIEDLQKDESLEREVRKLRGEYKKGKLTSTERYLFVRDFLVPFARSKGYGFEVDEYIKSRSLEQSHGDGLNKNIFEKAKEKFLAKKIATCIAAGLGAVGLGITAFSFVGKEDKSSKKEPLKNSQNTQDYKESAENESNEELLPEEDDDDNSPLRKSTTSRAANLNSGLGLPFPRYSPGVSLFKKLLFSPLPLLPKKGPLRKKSTTSNAAPLAPNKSNTSSTASTKPTNSKNSIMASFNVGCEKLARQLQGFTNKNKPLSFINCAPGEVMLLPSRAEIKQMLEFVKDPNFIIRYTEIFDYIDRLTSNYGDRMRFRKNPAALNKIYASATFVSLSCLHEKMRIPSKVLNVLKRFSIKKTSFDTEIIKAFTKEFGQKETNSLTSSLWKIIGRGRGR